MMRRRYLACGRDNQQNEKRLLQCEVLLGHFLVSRTKQRSRSRVVSFGDRAIHSIGRSMEEPHLKEEWSYGRSYSYLSRFF